MRESAVAAIPKRIYAIRVLDTANCNTSAVGVGVGDIPFATPSTRVSVGDGNKEPNVCRVGVRIGVGVGVFVGNGVGEGVDVLVGMGVGVGEG